MWIGHGGLLFVSGKTKIIIDPYLSNSLSAIDASLSRKLRIKHKLLRIKPNALILTSSLPEHTDWKTIKKYLKKRRKNKVAVLSCRTTYDKMVFENEPFRKKVMKKITKKQKIYKNANHFVFGPGMEWSAGNLTIKGVSAYGNDPFSFGVIITDRTDGKRYYVAGPTMYNEKLFDEIPDDLYAAFVPVGGEFGMMNNIDAVRFAKRIDAEFVIPISYGMFHKRLKPDEDFKVGGRVLPKAYRIIEFTLCPDQPLFTGGLDIFYNEKEPKKDKDEKSEEEKDVDAIVADGDTVTVDAVLSDTTQVDISNQDKDIEELSKAENEVENVEPSQENAEILEATAELSEETVENTEESVEEVAELTTEIAEPTTEVAEVITEIAEPTIEVAELTTEIAEPTIEVAEVIEEIAEPTIEVEQNEENSPFYRQDNNENKNNDTL